jgi:hypothetical protein
MLAKGLADDGEYPFPLCDLFIRPFEDDVVAPAGYLKA